MSALQDVSVYETADSLPTRGELDFDVLKRRWRLIRLDEVNAWCGKTPLMRAFNLQGK
jgi:hypothetical protein